MHAMAPFSALLLDPVRLEGWQGWVQPALVLLSVAAAAAWLTARWLIRRRSGCTGDCSRCAAHEPSGTACHKPSGLPGPRGLTGGIRPPGLHVLQGPTNLPRSGDV